MFALLLMVMSRSLMVSTIGSEGCEPLRQGSNVTFDIEKNDVYLWYKVAVEDTQINITVTPDLSYSTRRSHYHQRPFISSNTEHFMRIRLYESHNGRNNFIIHSWTHAKTKEGTVGESKSFTENVPGYQTITKVMVESNASVEWIKCLNHYSFPSLSSYNPGDSPACNKSTVLLVVLSVLWLALVAAAAAVYLWRTKTKGRVVLNQVILDVTPRTRLPAPLPAAVGDGSSREVNDDDEHLYEDWNDDVISPRSHTSRNSLYVSADEQTATVSAIKTEEQLE